MFRHNFFDNEFDNFFSSDFFNRPRRYESKLLHGYYSPSRLIESRYPRQLVRRDFEDDWLAHFNDGKIFTGFDENVTTKEEPDKYIVSFKGEDLKNKGLKVDFRRKENELTISVEEKKTEEKEGVTSSYTNSYQSSVRFDKKVRPDDVSADFKDNTVVITIPKLECDEENVVNVSIEGHNVDHLIDEAPAKTLAEPVEEPSKTTKENSK
ncbi:18 kDa heat shock protein (HSP 18) [Scheffersomyces stipitis CBS 6054]|uniref:18 kDa heat shock protein (HSP 18) n=1 Tax=Scheffersomyces stipitis (strain ATCC 58785 / CBS 6054 / NBRC 10063 / NRRL Y-11545) TaxID=322104 RepID=A3LUI9_PICST|nr:18 kDa heat shock protein (HSP 18) [Scheffersomyces stipitis CBS 6054]ABN66247.2 18 kDa heat shock protein (HSP 18) [Scheffersomyces stipitis CBS 6054]KAG2732912.1 hypothetical protein G9P44_003902 [Scheffersomyces stipitis]